MNQENNESAIRKKAEERLLHKSKDLGENPRLSPEKLPQELQVHQIELELQNEELKRSQEQLEEERSRYGTLFNLAPMGYLSLDRDSTIDELNYAAENMLGRSRAHLFGSKITDYIYPEDQDVFYFHFQDILTMGEGKPTELRMIKPDNEVFHVRIQSSSVREIEKGISIFLVIMDISEMKSVQRDLEYAKEEAEAANKAKSRFLANMSHEVRTPMNGIIGMLELSLMAPLPEEQKEHLRLAKRSADNLLYILNDILDLSKIEADKLVLEKQPFDIKETVYSTSRLFSVPAREKKLELVAAVDPKIPQYLVGDSLRLKQVLFNLLSNAVKFTEQGEILLQLILLNKVENRAEIKCICQDTGIGISDEGMKKLFGTFSQIEDATTRRYGGTGLGLAISSRLIEMMNSTISVDSTEDRGSTFSFTLELEIPRGHKGERENFPADGERDYFAVVVEPHDLTGRIITLFLDHLAVPYLSFRGMEEAEEAFKNWRDLEETKGTEAQKLVFLPGFDTAEESVECADTVARYFMGKADYRIVSMNYPVDMPNVREHAGKGGIDGFLEKPISEEGLKSVFTQESSPEAVAPPLGAPEIESAEENHQIFLTVLVAEDNEINMRVVREFFEKKECKVIPAENGKEAVEKFLIEGENIDIVLMDVQMPVMDGLEATRKLRRESGLRGREVPIVAMTAYARAADRERCFLAGMDDYVTKPVVSMEELMSLVQRNLPEKKRKKEEDSCLEERARVMVVEDENISRMYISKLLRGSGHSVVELKRGEGVLEKIGEEPVDMIFMDFHLPGLRGDQIAVKLFEESETRDIPVILLTGSSRGDLEESIFPENVVDIITKPIGKKKLCETVKKYCSPVHKM
ncbi:MAG: response regulator [Spirochaetaceae bacterium]